MQRNNSLVFTFKTRHVEIILFQECLKHEK